MLNVFMLVSGVDEDDEVLDQLDDQGVSVDDWDIIIAIPADQEGVSEHFTHNDEGKVICTEWQLDRLVEGSCGDSVWYEEIEVNNETCWVGVKHH